MENDSLFNHYDSNNRTGGLHSRYWKRQQTTFVCFGNRILKEKVSQGKTIQKKESQKFKNIQSKKYFWAKKLG